MWKKNKYLNKWHICWGEIQPAAESPPLRRPAVLVVGVCALTLFLEAEALTLEVNTDG